MVGKLEKAKRYAQERDRFKFKDFSVMVHGSNDMDHLVTYKDGKWTCDCSFFQTHGRCSHTMALEILLEDMVEISENEGGEEAGK